LVDPKKWNAFPLNAFDQPGTLGLGVEDLGAYIIIRILKTEGPFHVEGKIRNDFERGNSLDVDAVKLGWVCETVFEEPLETFLCGSAPVIAWKFSERALEPARPLAEIKILIGMEAEHLDGGKGKPDENHRKKEGAESRRLFP
jgi:hypothetical protein